MTDIIDDIVRMPGHGVRISEEAGDALSTFLRAIKDERDRDTIVGVAAGVIAIMVNREFRADPSRIIGHMNRISREVYGEWRGR